MADFVRRRVDVIATVRQAPALAAKAATTTIPIVFRRRRPGQDGYCRKPSSARRQHDRYQFLSPEVAAKRLGILQSLPKAVRIAALVNRAGSPFTSEATL